VEPEPQEPELSALAEKETECIPDLVVDPDPTYNEMEIVKKVKNLKSR
jgi:hypothetical protein